MSQRDPLIRRLADADPVPPEHVDGEARSFGARHLLARLTEDDGQRDSRKGNRRTGWMAVASVVLAVLVAVGVVVWLGGEAPATAAEELQRTAAVAASRPPSVDAGRYFYAKTEADQLTTSGKEDEAWSAVQSVVEQIWIAPNGAGRIRSDFGELRFPGARDRQRWEASGSQTFASGISDDVFPAGVLAYEDVPSLPTDVRGLDRVLRRQVVAEEPPADIGVFLRCGELLARADASPDLRAALYRVVAGLPGVELVGDTTDAIGRPGVAVAMTYNDKGARVRTFMIFDETTSKLLARVLILLERATWVDAPPGTRLWYVAYLESGRTDSTDGPP